jgi:hypothetical protein
MIKKLGLNRVVRTSPALGRWCLDSLLVGFSPLSRRLIVRTRALDIGASKLPTYAGIGTPSRRSGRWTSLGNHGEVFEMTTVLGHAASTFVHRAHGRSQRQLLLTEALGDNAH